MSTQKTIQRQESSPEVTIFVDQLSQPSRSLMAFTETCKIPAKTVSRVIDRIGKKDLKFIAEFKKISPMLTVPAAKTEDFVFTESCAILRFLAQKYPKHTQELYPALDRIQEARVENFYTFYHSILRPMTKYPFGKLYATKIQLETIIDLKEDKKAVYRGLEALANRYRLAESIVEGDKSHKFVFGRNFTVFDILAFSEVMQLNMIGFDLKGSFPGIWKWVLRCKEVCPALVDAHVLVAKIAEKNGHKFWLA